MTLSDLNRLLLRLAVLPVVVPLERLDAAVYDLRGFVRRKGGLPPLPPRKGGGRGESRENP
jgi:hypothetical protein